MINPIVKLTEETTTQPAEGASAQSAQEAAIESTDESSHASTENSEQSFGDHVSQLKVRLALHLSNEPKKPRKIKHTYNNATTEALYRGMYENGSSAGLMSDEAGNIFNGRALNDLAMMNLMRDGSTIQVERVGDGGSTVRDPRFSFMGMIQPGAFRKYFERRGEEALDIGFFARCFFCYPVSTQGTRLIWNTPPLMQYQTKFHARISEVLNQNLLDAEDPEFIRPTLEFSPEATQLWIDAFNEIESYLYPGQYFADISDYGSKFAENLARMAALFHYFTGEKGDISYETTNRALAICKWFMTEFKRLFASEPEVPIEQSDAHQIEVWLAGLLQSNSCKWSNGIPYVKKNDVRQFGPNSVRNNSRLNAAFEYLSFCNRARIVKFEKTYFVELNHQYFAELIHYLQIQGRENYQGLPQQNCLPNRRW